MREQRPSAAACFLRCIGQPALVDSLDLPPTPTTDYAAEGSAAHMLGEKCLNEKVDADSYLTKFLDVDVGVTAEGERDVRRFLITCEFTEPVQKYLDIVRREAHGNVLLVERK